MLTGLKLNFYHYEEAISFIKLPFRPKSMHQQGKDLAGNLLQSKTM